MRRADLIPFPSAAVRKVSVRAEAVTYIPVLTITCQHFFFGAEKGRGWPNLHRAPCMCFEHQSHDPKCTGEMRSQPLQQGVLCFKDLHVRDLLEERSERQ